MTAFADFFNSDFLCKYFKENMRGKKGGGRDGLSWSTFWKRYGGEMDDIAERCLKGTYRFSPYREKLVMKGRGKIPRVLSVPSFRDRLVLGVLHEYLKSVFDCCIGHVVPNKLIVDVCDYMAMHGDGEEVKFYKFDFHDFYGSIDHVLLKEKLDARVEDAALRLVMCAIKTPTVCGKPKGDDMHPTDKGLPQGLAISNLLSSVYMAEFDAFFAGKEGHISFYRRYVDDILALGNSDDDEFLTLFEEKVAELKLQLSAGKTCSGKIGERNVDYIGYVIKSKTCVSIRPKNIQSLLARVARLVCLFKQQYRNPYLRPNFVKKEEELIDYYIELLNEELSGFKSEDHLYGWMPYFQSMTDIQLLYSLDSVIHRKFLVDKDIPYGVEKRVYFLHNVYWDVKKTSGKRYFFDFDSIVDATKMKVILEKRGLVDSGYTYSDEQIRHTFEEYKQYRKKAAMLSIGRTS